MDISNYVSKESLLDAIRSRNAKGNTNVSENLRGAIPGYSGSDTGIAGTGWEETHVNNGRDASDDDRKGGTDGIDSEFGFLNNEHAASGGSDDKHSRPIPGDGSNTTKPASHSQSSSVKNKWQLFRDTIKSRTPPTTKKPSSNKVKGKTLTVLEVAKLRPKLIHAIEWQSEHADHFITATTKRHVAVVIWSDISMDDIEIIADFLLERGKSDVQTAIVVRAMAELLDKVKVGLVVLPRAWRTIAYYLQTGISIK